MDFSDNNNYFALIEIMPIMGLAYKYKECIGENYSLGIN